MVPSWKKRVFGGVFLGLICFPILVGSFVGNFSIENWPIPLLYVFGLIWLALGGPFVSYLVQGVLMAALHTTELAPIGRFTGALIVLLFYVAIGVLLGPWILRRESFRFR